MVFHLMSSSLLSQFPFKIKIKVNKVLREPPCVHILKVHIFDPQYTLKFQGSFFNLLITVVPSTTYIS